MQPHAGAGQQAGLSVRLSAPKKWVTYLLRSLCYPPPTLLDPPHPPVLFVLSSPPPTATPILPYTPPPLPAYSFFSRTAFFYSRISAHRWAASSSRGFEDGGSAWTAYALKLKLPRTRFSYNTHTYIYILDLLHGTPHPLPLTSFVPYLSLAKAT